MEALTYPADPVANASSGVDCRAHPVTALRQMPRDAATTSWSSLFLQLRERNIPRQDVAAAWQADIGKNFSWNMWRVIADHAPTGSLAEARRLRRVPQLAATDDQYPPKPN